MIDADTEGEAKDNFADNSLDFAANAECVEVCSKCFSEEHDDGACAIKNLTPQSKPMNYMQQFEAELRDQVAQLVHHDEVDEKELNAFVRWAKEKHLASYRNGVEVGRKDSPNLKRGNYKNKSK